MTYLLTQLGISSLVLIAWFLLYKLAFAKLTFFALNRVYLLVGLVFAITVPFMQFESPWALSAPERNSKPESSVILIYDAPKHIETSLENSETAAVQTKAQSAPAAYSAPSENITINYTQVLLYIYFAGVMLSLIWFGVKLMKVNMIRGGSKTSSVGYKNLKVIINPGDAPSYSFFNKIYISENDFNSQFAEKIFEHEYLHFRKMHSLDLIFAEMFKAAMWFNPVIYMYCNAIRDNHEFEVDRAVVREEADKTEYYQSLVNRTIGAQFVDLPSYFNKSTLLRRFEMLDKKKSNATSLWQYISIIPVASLFILVFACTQPGKDKAENKVEKKNAKKFEIPWDREPSPRNGLPNLVELAKTELAAFIGVDPKENAAEFRFAFEVDSSGKLKNVKITDTTWIENVPSDDLKREYAAKAYQYFMTSSPWHPAMKNDKPVKVAQAVDIFYGSDEMWNSAHQPTTVIRQSKYFPGYLIAGKVPGLTPGKITFPTYFQSSHVDQVLSGLKMKNASKLSDKTGKLVLAFDLNEFGKIVNAKVISSFQNEVDKSALAALSRIKGIKPPKQNGKAFSQHLELTIGFVSKTATREDHFTYIGCVLPNFEEKAPAKKKSKS